MSVSPEEVQVFAELAKLRLSRQEAERLRGDLNRILEHVDRLGDLEDGAPAPPGPDGGGPMEARPASPGRTARDEPPPGRTPPEKDGPQRAPDAPEALTHGPEQMAPAWQDGFFLAPSPGGMEPERP